MMEMLRLELVELFETRDCSDLLTKYQLIPTPGSLTKIIWHMFLHKGFTIYHNSASVYATAPRLSLLEAYVENAVDLSATFSLALHQSIVSSIHIWF